MLLCNFKRAAVAAAVETVLGEQDVYLLLQLLSKKLKGKFRWTPGFCLEHCFSCFSHLVHKQFHMRLESLIITSAAWQYW